MMPLKEGEQVIIKKPCGVLVGTVVSGRPEQAGVAEEDRLYRVHIDDTCVCRNADLQVVNERTEMKPYSAEWNAEHQRWVNAGQRLLADVNDQVALEEFSEAGRKIGFLVRKVK